MARTGLVVLAFLIYHLADFTFRVQHPEWASIPFGFTTELWCATFTP